MNVLFNTRPAPDGANRRERHEREERFYREHGGRGPRTVTRLAALFGGGRMR